MKKIFTLITVAFFACTANAQDVYNAIVDGKLNTEFATVAGEDGGVANNAADGKSIVIMTAGKATVTAVGGTTPANDETKGSGAQQITIGKPIEGKENCFEIASVAAWNDIKWERKSQGDIDFWYITGTGNPYVNIYAKQNSKDGELLEDNYSAAYDYYEPDGSNGLPITGLYYKFTASVKGAFKVKVWANKGNRKTFVVNEATKKAERLLASGYINGVNGVDGKKKLLTVEQVDSVHHVYIWGDYDKAVANGKGDTETQDEFDARIAKLKETAEANEVERQYVIGNGNQNFWGWLTFDVEAGETYWVFQHSSQIGFGGFEFHEGKTAEELINGIEAAYVYATNFSTYTNEEGERVTWYGEKAVGNGTFATEEAQLDENDKPINIVPFGNFFRNDGSAKRTSYCLLPEDVLAHSAKTEALTIAVWVRAQAEAVPTDYSWTPIFTAYGSGPASANTWPMLACQYRGVLQLNCAGWTDYVDAQNTGGVNKLYHNTLVEGVSTPGNGGPDWLSDKKWHYYTAVFEGEKAKVFIDGELKNEWDNTKVAERTQKGLFSNGADLKYICLGGNQAWDWADNDAPFDFAKLLIKNTGMTAGEIKAQMKADFGDKDMEKYYSGSETGIEAIKANKQNVDNAIYNLAGQRVDESFKGVVIQNGKKSIKK